MMAVAPLQSFGGVLYIGPNVRNAGIARVANRRACWLAGCVMGGRGPLVPPALQGCPAGVGDVADR
eukprot:13906940-Alexandrium_andersonii.AAC.1